MNDRRPSESRNAERELFLQALDRLPGERAGFLDEACGSDRSLRTAVEALLQYHSEDSFFLASPAVRGGSLTAPSALVGEKPGDRVGQYKLLQQIGEGGVGIVFMAEQEAPVRRRVALKVLKPGMDTKAVIARFESERQALALMDHPNIAKVLDAGSTPAGRPFFVMELVRGSRITEFCDQNRLPTRERLGLFMQVCQAIQHAHQKGIIHRDLKPSNILVTLHDGAPVPVVIDFGIAKAIDQKLTDKTYFTEFHSLIGTPAYISPEQAEMSGLDIDTRADIYSLGVLLYEILTGRTPFDARELWSSGLDEMRRTIREKDPAPPSTCLRLLPEAELTRTAQRRQMEAAKLTGVVRGDLDWIVLKALEKDRRRRYGTASELAQDIRRHLENEPILARPPSAGYRMGKLVRRNRLVVAGAGAVVAALVIGLGLSTWQFVEKGIAYRRAVAAEHEQSRLRSEAEEARKLAEIEALTARRQAYAADMNLVQQALAANNLGRAQELLSRHRPEAVEGPKSMRESAWSIPGPRAGDLRGWEWRYLWQQCQSEALFTLCQVSNEVYGLSVSHDAKWVAVGEYGGNGLSVWDLRARQEIARFPAGESQEPFAFSPTAPWLAFCSKERSSEAENPGVRHRVRLWDPVTRRLGGDFPVAGGCRAVAFSADGARLLIADDRDEFVIWSVARETRLSSVRFPKSKGSSEARPPWGGRVALARDLDLAAEVLGGGEIRVLDLKSGRELWSGPAAEENVTALAFSPDGTKLASGAGFVESAVRLWDVASGRELARLEGHRTYVRSVVFWPDGEMLASASGDQTIHLWNVASVRAPATRSEPSASGAPDLQRGPNRARPKVPEIRPSATLRGHRLEVWSLALCSDNTTLVSGAKDGSVCVWDTLALRRERDYVKLPVPARAWSFLPDGQAILALDSQGNVARWQGVDFQQNQTVMKLGTNPAIARFSFDGRFLATFSGEGPIRIWDLQRGELLGSIASEEKWEVPAAFPGPSDRLVTRNVRDGRFREWDVTTGRETWRWEPIAPRMGRASAFSPDERWFLALDGEGGGVLRDRSKEQTTRFDFNLKQITAAAVSPEGRWLAVVSGLGFGQLWDAAVARPTATLRGFLLGAHSVAFSPNGQRLAVGSNGSEAIKLWTVEGPQELLTLQGEGSMFVSTAFSPEGGALASSNGEGILHIWRAPSFEEIARLEARGR